ncbi:hypothetical protein DCM91_14665 [Chitinophaga costaii]|nr:hypothetical protein DCM91_14665 [Chitinophaga costaii]
MPEGYLAVEGWLSQGGDYKFWFIAWLYDLSSYFMAVFIQVLYNNYIYKSGLLPDLSSIENYYLFFVFFILKEPLLLRFLVRKTVQ